VNALIAEDCQRLLDLADDTLEEKDLAAAGGAGATTRAAAEKRFCDDQHDLYGDDHVTAVDQLTRRTAAVVVVVHVDGPRGQGTVSLLLSKPHGSWRVLARVATLPAAPGAPANPASAVTSP
jgi:hypothetical protein